MTKRPPKSQASQPKVYAPATARSAALDALLRVRDAAAPGLAECLVEVGLADSRDLGLAREIAYGVARHGRWLEESLKRALRDYRPPNKRVTRMAVICAVYQHAFLDRIPPHAIVSEAVELIKARDHNPRIAGWANSILRQMAKTPPERFLPGEDLPWPLRFSAPEELIPFVARALEDDGEQAAFWGSAQETAPLVLRGRGPEKDAMLPRLAEQLAGRANVRQSRWLPDAYIVEQAPGLSPAELPLFRDGQLTVEDEGAQLAVSLATAGDVRGRVLDLCAAPGGKTAYLLDRHGEGDLALTATDVSEAKLERLRETLARLGLEGRAGLGIAEEVLTESPEGDFHLVLLDAPCSGLGTIRRHPEIKVRRHPEDIAQLARIQKALLHRAARLVEPGGLLAYTVCTVTREEGEEVIDDFLVMHPEFTLEPAPAEALPFDPEPFRCDSGLYRTWTHRDGCDCFTAARLRRQS